MKKKLLLIFVSFIFVSSSFCQNTVKLKINHMLDDEVFALNSATHNNLNNNFDIHRLEYYISGISIQHESILSTNIEDRWILVNASGDTEINLGSYNISDVHSIKFHIGVNPEVNHLDPASYDSGHPLAPQAPSMHWGWASGYRFLAMEGNGGSGLNQTFEIHALGDDNYFGTTVEVSASASNGEVIIELDADYTKVLEDINVSSGLILHGDYDQAVTSLENMRDHVFTPTTFSSSIEVLEENDFFYLSPNPTTNGIFNLNYAVPSTSTFEIVVTDFLGREVNRIPVKSGTSSVSLKVEKSGMYLVSLLNHDQVLVTKKLMAEF